MPKMQRRRRKQQPTRVRNVLVRKYVRGRRYRLYEARRRFKVYTRFKRI